jgi:hypothetical protein
MPVIATTLGTDWKERREPPRLLELCLRKLIPAASPDFEGCYPSVSSWWIEVNDAGVPQREIGFDSSGSAVVIGPSEKNFGFWTDSSMTFSAGKYQAVSPIDFEVRWRSFQESWTKRHGTNHIEG